MAVTVNAAKSPAQPLPMTATLIDGKSIAAKLRDRVRDAVRILTGRHAIFPGLAVVLVGHDPASDVYVAAKKKMAAEAGIRSIDHRLPASASEGELLALIGGLNKDPNVHGILVQLPLPPQINVAAVITAIDPGKDVDGFHPLNVGRLMIGLPALTPCTPLACIELAKSVHASLAGLNALVIGRSAIVGKPLAQLLMAENSTVTVAHSKTVDLPAVARRADLVFAAIGKPEFVSGDWIKPGATVIDVGINRVIEGGRQRIVGDVAFEEARRAAAAITPVPGGVGPVTIACLLANTLSAACALTGLPHLSLNRGL
jgi:methylenetetrahydrofolate dehydrogenase (NADP+) / methenyltetrahydrofolate cyclohydrolase